MERNVTKYYLNYQVKFESKKGNKIEIGQTICIIEAMKIFNEIESEVAGIIEDILVKDITPVEYGQKIISVKLDD